MLNEHAISGHENHHRRQLLNEARQDELLIRVGHEAQSQMLIATARAAIRRGVCAIVSTHFDLSPDAAHRRMFI